MMPPRKLLGASLSVLLAGCGAPDFAQKPAHLTISAADAAAAEAAPDEQLPPLVRASAVESETADDVAPAADAPTYDVVVIGAPVREVLLALARDSGVEMDVDERISGAVSLSALNETLDAILTRIQRQISIRVERVGDALVIVPDTPYHQHYMIDHLNVARSYASSATTSGIAETGSADISNAADNNFWRGLEETLQVILSGGDARAGAPAAPVVANTFSLNRETGALVVYAPQALQQEVGKLLDAMLAVVKRQVLLEATVVEVILNNQYSQGIDWSVFGDDALDGISFYQGAAVGGPAAALAASALEAPDPITPEFLAAQAREQLGLAPTNLLPDSFFTAAFRAGDISAAVQLLSRFGEAKVLSSPRISALNYQPALLRVVDQEVYFDIEVTEEVDDQTGDVRERVFEVTENIVDVGFSMNVLPYISDAGDIVLNLKPTVARILEYRAVPSGVATGAAVNVVNRIPIMRIRELDSVISLRDGEIAVLGGLLEDRVGDSDTGVPGLSQLPALGDLFAKKEETTYKTEFIVFIKARILNNPSVSGDLNDYRHLLPAVDFIDRARPEALFPPVQDWRN